MKMILFTQDPNLVLSKNKKLLLKLIRYCQLLNHIKLMPEELKLLSNLGESKLKIRQIK
jgi:hypothetical protein